MKWPLLPMAAIAALAVADGRAAAVPDASRPEARALDLTSVRNRSWRDSESVRGWNATPGCVAPDAIPNGRLDAFGIPFEVVNGRTAGGKDFVLLSAEGFGGAPRRVSVDIPVGTGPGAVGTGPGALALLHAAGRAAHPGTPHGVIRFAFADGTTNVVPVVSGTDISDWWMGAGGTNAICAYRQGDAPQPMRVFASVFPVPARKPLAAVAFEVGDSPGALWMIGAATLLKEPVRLPDWRPPRKAVYPASSKAVIRQTTEGARFENPVIRRNWSDPTVWTDGDRWYSAATGLEDTLASADLVNWTSLGRSPVPEEERRKATAWTTSTSFWAPDVVKVGGRWLLYCTVMESSEKNRIAAFAAERPEGPFAFQGFVRGSEGTGIPDLCVDPEVVVDARGDVWLFSGSVGGIHRGRLTADGLRPLPGSRLARVTADGIEGGYLFRRGGWWYLFGSTGHYNEWTYAVNVVRSRTLDGVFVDRAGKPATAGRYERILSSAEGDEIDGPGHNGEIFTLPDGRTYMFYHAHRRRLMPRPDESIQVPRPTCLQEVFWDADGWPRFTGGKPQLLERLPCAEKPLFANPVISPNGPDPTEADIQRVIDAHAGGTAVVPPGAYDIGATVFVPSDTKLVLKGCRLRMRDGAVCPMFRNRTDARGDARNIVVDGGGTAVLDGGLPNGLDEFTSGKDGRPHVSENLTLFFTGVDGFSVTGLTVRDQRWWALMFLECANGRIADITFELTRHAQDSYARWRNQDGIDLRVGCHDIVIEDIRGETGDDFIALTALDSPWFERKWARPGRDRAIRDITIRHVKGRTNQCALIRILSHFGQPIHHVTIADVVEDSVPGRHNQTQMAVRIGDRLPAYYANDERNAQRFGDIHDIQVDGLTTRALSAVHTDDGVRNLTVRNVRLFGDAGSVWTGGTFGLDIAPFIYLPAREGEVRRSTLTPGKMEEWGVSRADTVRLENVLFDGVTVEATPHDGEALFRFRRAELVNCRVRNLRAPAGRKMCDGTLRGRLVFEGKDAAVLKTR